MRISQKADYALRAMLDLAVNARPSAAVRSAAIAQRAQIPEKFLEAIFVDLRKAGLVRSRRGRSNGSARSRPTDKLRETRDPYSEVYRLAVAWRRTAGPARKGSKPPRCWAMRAHRN